VYIGRRNNVLDYYVWCGVIYLLSTTYKSSSSTHAIINEGNYKSHPLPNTLSALFVSTITNQGTITHLGAGFKLSDVLSNSGTLVVSSGTLFKNQWIINN
jgi:hypothetical protein